MIRHPTDRFQRMEADKRKNEEKKRKRPASKIRLAKEFIKEQEAEDELREFTKRD